MVYWVVGGVVLAIIISCSLKRSAGKRNRDLDEWAASVHVTERQQHAMCELWEASRAHKPPVDDPLCQLSQDDREYILKICSADYRPARFGHANVLRMATFIKLTEEGFSSEQAAVVVGMIFNGVGKMALARDRNSASEIG